VLAGYSQGAQLVHNAAQRTSAANAAKVAAGTSTSSLVKRRVVADVFQLWSLAIQSEASLSEASPPRKL
jgi:hypothetical protein